MNSRQYSSLRNVALYVFILASFVIVCLAEIQLGPQIMIKWQEYLKIELNEVTRHEALLRDDIERVLSEFKRKEELAPVFRQWMIFATMVLFASISLIHWCVRKVLAEKPWLREVSSAAIFFVVTILFLSLTYRSGVSYLLWVFFYAVVVGGVVSSVNLSVEDDLQKIGRDKLKLEKLIFMYTNINYTVIAISVALGITLVLGALNIYVNVAGPFASRPIVGQFAILSMWAFFGDMIIICQITVHTRNLNQKASVDAG